jgi:hypothetical protein
MSITSPKVSMCPHVITADMKIPFSLYIRNRSVSYLCSICLVSALQRRLLMPGQTPATVAESVSFSHCDHEGSEKRPCWWCLETACAAVTLEWGRLFHTDRPTANKLRRITAAWQRHYDPRGVRALHTTPQEAGLVQPRQTAHEIAEDRRTRMDAERIAKRREGIRQWRGFPAQSILTAQGPQASRIEVVKT